MSNNPIAIQSKKWIIDALLELMNRKAYRFITVREISSKALIDRRTFYRHFECKDDVLRLVIDDITTEYLNSIKGIAPTDTYTITKNFFEICLINSDFINLLYRNNLMYFLLDKFYTNLPIIHAQVRSDEMSKTLSQDIDYFLFYHAGGFWSLLLKWVIDGMKKSPNDLAILASTITNRLI